MSLESWISFICTPCCGGLRGVACWRPRAEAACRWRPRMVGARWLAKPLTITLTGSDLRRASVDKTHDLKLNVLGIGNTVARLMSPAKRWRAASHNGRVAGYQCTAACNGCVSATRYPHMFHTRAEKARSLINFAEFRLQKQKDNKERN